MRKQCGSWRNFEEEEGSSMQLQCCNKDVICGDVWFLKDVKGFTARKMFIGHCSVCDNDVAILIETRLEDKKTFINKLNGIEALKTIFREKKRKVAVVPDIKTDSLFGWVYGVNKEIKNKQGKVTQVRQYACSLDNNKKVLIKQIVN